MFLKEIKFYQRSMERRGGERGDWLACLMGMQQKAPVSRLGLAESSVLIDRDGAGVDEVTGFALFVDLDFGEQPLLLPVFPQLFYVGKSWIGYAEHIQVLVKQAMTADFGQHLGHMGTLLEQGGQIQDSHVELNEGCTKNKQNFWRQQR